MASSSWASWPTTAVFQFYNLISSLTVRENVAPVTGIARDPIPVDDHVAQVGLTERADHFPARLSTGERQRVAIVRAIVKRPELLCAKGPSVYSLRIPEVPQWRSFDAANDCGREAFRNG